MNYAELDVVIPYKITYSDELRYALRSLKNLPHRRVFVVGDLPDWADNITHIQIPKRGINRFMDVEEIIRLICANPEVSDDFILMNDDFFIMNKVDKLPNWHMGTIADEYIRRKQITHNNYVKGYKLTDEYLKSLGVKEPLDYCLHVPCVLNKVKRMVVSDLRLNQLRNAKVLLSRSMYFNLFGGGSTLHDDVKYIKLDNGFDRGDFLSTLDSSFAKGEVGRYIKKRFSERGQYEK